MTQNKASESPRGKNLDKKIGECRHCGGDIAMRNPSGFCDHLYYPEACDVCAEPEKTVSEYTEQDLRIQENKIVGNFKMKICDELKPTPSLHTQILDEFDKNFKHTDKNEVGYVPAFETQKIKSWLSSALERYGAAKEKECKNCLKTSCPCPHSFCFPKLCEYCLGLKKEDRKHCVDCKSGQCLDNGCSCHKLPFFEPWVLKIGDIALGTIMQDGIDEEIWKMPRVRMLKAISEIRAASYKEGRETGEKYGKENNKIYFSERRNIETAERNKVIAEIEEMIKKIYRSPKWSAADYIKAESDLLAAIERIRHKQ